MYKRFDFCFHTLCLLTLFNFRWSSLVDHKHGKRVSNSRHAFGPVFVDERETLSLNEPLELLEAPAELWLVIASNRLKPGANRLNGRLRLPKYFQQFQVTVALLAQRLQHRLTWARRLHLLDQGFKRCCWRKTRQRSKPNKAIHIP